MDDNLTSGSVCVLPPFSIKETKLSRLLQRVEGRQDFPRLSGHNMAPTHNLHSGMVEIPQGHMHLPDSYSDRIEPSHVINAVQPTTLQSVLRGEIPDAYSHLTSQSRCTDLVRTGNPLYTSEFRHEHVSPSHCFERTSMSEGHSDRYTTSHSVSPQHRIADSPPSPCQDSWSHQDSRSRYDNRSPYHEPSPSSVHCYDQRSPCYDSRSSPYRDSGSPFIDHRSSPYYSAGSPFPSSSSHRSASSPYSQPHSPFAPPHSPYTNDGYSSSGFQSPAYNDDQPMDLSCKSDNGGNSPAHLSDFDDTQDHKTDGSLLRNLLCIGKHKLVNRNCETESNSSCTSQETYKPDVPVTSTTRVTLAKKMMYPIASRVSDWLVKIVQFAKSIPEFSSLSQNDKMTLLINSWTRLLLLRMAENEFEFAVTPLPVEQQSPDVTPSPDEPTVKSVEGIQSFIKKCKNMSLDQKEYALLRMAVLFNAGYAGLDNPELIEKLNSVVQQLLQQHVTATRPDDVMHYSRLLMCLPSLYGINCRMFENLFCTRINSSTDIEVLLKEMLQNV